jgi:hypothetical protein
MSEMLYGDDGPPGDDGEIPVSAKVLQEQAEKYNKFVETIDAVATSNASAVQQVKGAHLSITQEIAEIKQEWETKRQNRSTAAISSPTLSDLSPLSPNKGQGELSASLNISDIKPSGSET